MWPSVDPVPFVENTILSPLILLGTLVKHQWAIGILVYFHTLDYNPLVYMFFVPELHCFNYHCFAVSSEFVKCEFFILFFFFKIVWTILGPLKFHKNLNISLLISTNNSLQFS